MRKLGYAFAAVIVAGCASKSSEIAPSYVSPVTYQNHSCQQLAMEAQAISSRAAQVSGAQDQKRTNDQIATGVAIVVFWPAAFLVGGDGPMAAELANLKGQMVAVEQASIQKQCAINFQRTAEGGTQAIYSPPPPPPPTPPRVQRGSPKAKQPPQAARQQLAPVMMPVTSAEPPEPQLSERDRAMGARN